MRYPVTVRDAQRFLRSPARVYAEPQAACEILRAAGACRRDAPCREWIFLVHHPLWKEWGDSWAGCRAAGVGLRLLDRMAHQKGPNAVLLPGPQAQRPAGSGESRPKGTDEVRPQGDNPSEGSPFHGGDGSSGEVGDPAPTGGRQPGDSPDGTGAQSAAGTGSGRTAPAEAGEESGCREEPPARGDGVGSGGAPYQSGDKAGAGPKDAENIPGCAMMSPADAPQEAGEPTGRAAGGESARGEPQEPGGGEDGPPALPKGRKFVLAFGRRRRGGWSLASFASLADVEADPAAVNALRRIFGRFAGGGAEDSGPRWDWDAFCVRLLTARPLAPARREEEVNRPAVLVMVDTSGSCSGFTDRSLPVAKAAGKLGVPGCSVVVVNHANGYPHEVEVDGRPQPVPSFWDDDAEDCDVRERVVAWFDGLLRRYSLRLVVNLGDLDAEWLCVRLASLRSVRLLVWLDNYACNYLCGPTPPRRQPEWPPEVARKTRYYIGCATVGHLVEGLEEALRDFSG